jgi:predicted permease
MGKRAMKTFVGLFATSASFGLAIAIVYWFVAHEETVGVTLLAIMTAALVFTAGYAVIAERNARLDGDAPDRQNGDVAGEDLGVYTTESAWPILVAICSVFVLLGVVWSPFLAAIALVCLILCLWRLGAESARV